MYLAFPNRLSSDLLGRYRHLPAVAREPVAEAVQEQRAPVLFSGDPVLIRRDLRKTRDVLAIMQQRAHLGEDLRPAILELLEKREMRGVKDGSIRHQSLAPLIYGEPAGQSLASPLDPAPDRPLERLRSRRFLCEFRFTAPLSHRRFPPLFLGTRLAAEDGKAREDQPAQEPGEEIGREHV